MVDLHVALPLADPAADVILEIALHAVEVGQVLDAVGVGHGRLEPGPVERQPVRQGGREGLAEQVEPRQHLNQLPQQVLLGLQAARVLALRRREPGAQGLRELRLDDRREPESLTKGVRETGDHLVAAAHDGLAPRPGGDALQPPWLLEDRIDPGDRVAAPFGHRQRFGRDRRMLNHILSFPSSRSCSSHHAATGLLRMSVTPYGAPL